MTLGSIGWSAGLSRVQGCRARGVQARNCTRHYLSASQEHRVSCYHHFQLLASAIYLMANSAVPILIYLLFISAACAQSIETNHSPPPSQQSPPPSKQTPPPPPPSKQTPSSPPSSNQKPPSTSLPSIAVPVASTTGDRAPAGLPVLSRTQVIIISSCVAAVIAAAVIIGIVVRRRRMAALLQGNPQIVIGGLQANRPPAASAPPLIIEDGSFEFVKPSAP